ncbi:hypothetical protein CEXT_392391 [Caerostris extrusa]|uniref:Uncharacterized protein n=1 Tax=Caerostris extrusa TaxID=172846 RepID=A0AAV4Y349_CAEEX|nr:hypothetical protein CEXT_392391 [Caerostris extrusa]
MDFFLVLTLPAAVTDKGRSSRTAWHELICISSVGGVSQRLSRDTETLPDMSRELSSHCGGSHHRPAALLRGTHKCGPTHPERLLPVHAAAHRAGRRLLHAQPALLRQPGHHPAVRSRGDGLQRHVGGHVPVGRGADRPLRGGDAPAGHAALQLHRLRRRSHSRAGRLRRDPCQRSAVHPRFWRVTPQRCCHGVNKAFSNATRILQRLQLKTSTFDDHIQLHDQIPPITQLCDITLRKHRSG